MSLSTVNKILKSKLCLGCGLCETILSEGVCKMELAPEGVYLPKFARKLTAAENRKILKVCPAVAVQNDVKSGVWGPIQKVSESWSCDPVIRHKASSGGVISSLAIHLLESETVNAVLQVGVRAGSYLENELKISRSRNDIIQNCASRYAPALVFSKLKSILQATDDKFAFIGKPCDIAGIKNFIKYNPEFTHRVTHFIALFCAGMPSYNGTKSILMNSVSHDLEPKTLKYRGEGWPGFFVADYEGEESFKMSYNDSWGGTLCKHLPMRCKICPDGIGMLADIAVGDSWATKDGYPDFNEEEGRSFVLVRTKQGMDLFDDAVKNNIITEGEYSAEKISEVQKYQYQRRLIVGFRLIPVQIYTGFLLKFRNLSIIRNMFKANLRSGLSNMLGTSKRVFKS